MATTRDDIKSWFDYGVSQEEAAYMVVWCDSFDYTDYPSYYPDRKDTEVALNNPSSMQRAMEVYDLKADRDEQIALPCCWALTPEKTVKEQAEVKERHDPVFARLRRTARGKGIPDDVIDQVIAES